MSKKILIVGLGLLGGSIAQALKNQKNYTVYSLGRNEKRLEKAKEMGFIDEYSTKPEDIVNQSDIIVLCTPVSLIPEMAEKIYPFLNPQTLITDIGSTKSWICKNVQRILKEKKSNFLGAHPMAGSEKTGFENSKKDLFYNSPIVLTPTGIESKNTIEQVSDFWRLFSPKVHIMEAEKHDNIVAMTSHLPHAVSFAMSYYLYNKDESKENFFDIYGNGLLDTLRIAASDPNIWEDIIKTNRKNIADSLMEYKDLIGVLENWIRIGKYDEIVKLIKKAGNMREQLYSSARNRNK